MKQKIFTLIMMFVLVIVAGSAIAQTYNTTSVFPGGNYDYRVRNISATTNATVSVAYIPDAAGTGATPSAPSPASIVGGAAAVDVTFDVTYGTALAPSADGVIRLTVTQGACSNYIDLRIDVTDPPTWTLAITSNASGDNYGCQQPLASPLTNGSADAYNGGPNTVIFTVATSGTAPDGATLTGYTIAASGTMSPSCTSCGAQTAVGPFNATFLSAEGGGGNVIGTLTGATFTMDEAHGGGIYNFTLSGSPRTVTVSPLPTIGTFN